MRSWQNKGGQWILPIKTWEFVGKSNNNYDGEVVIANDYFVLNNVIDHQEELDIDGSGGGGGINPPFLKRQ